MRTAADVLAQLNRDGLPETLYLETGPVRLAVRCEVPMAVELRHHLKEALAEAGPVIATIDVLEGQNLSVQPDWIDWAREPGKAGRKDAYIDLEDGRLVHKIRSGMTFLQSPQALTAFGPCLAYPNQVINFINTQILNICKRDGWEICHAAAVTDGHKGLAIAGLSGGGKSTAILRMMDLEPTRFVTNDRLMVRATSEGTEGLGIPKNPRINPGTILHNPRLAPLLSEERKVELQQMPPEDLWQLEEKHDLFISEVYGPDRVSFTAPLTEFWVLNWSRSSTEPTRLLDADLTGRPDLLGAIMKSAGPFYQNANGVFLRDDEPLEPDAYLRQLKSVRIREVTGAIDFDALAVAGKDLFCMTGSAATGPMAVLIRHGDYHQRKNVPSALQPFPLTEKGKTQAEACGEDLATWLSDQRLTLNPIVYSSCQLRAWQTARLACDVLIKHGHTLTIEQTPSLAERSVGSAANLTLDEIETILTEDPRFDTPPVAWKSDSDYCLPLQGAESLIMAGQRVADHLTRTTAQQSAGTVTLHFGHGASFRHAAHLVGVLTRDQIAQYSMHHARPLHLCHIENGTWAQTGGTWKIRQLTDKTLD